MEMDARKDASRRGIAYRELLAANHTYIAPGLQKIRTKTVKGKKSPHHGTFAEFSELPAARNGTFTGKRERVESSDLI